MTSLPAGPPRGPAKQALPPSRAIASAPLAAQPPDTVMNSLAPTLVSGTGTARTRKTSSTAAMPAQRIFAISEKAPLGLEPCPYNVVRDRERMGRRQTIGVLAPHHGSDFVAREPAGVLQFPMINPELGGQCLGVTTDHQRHRKGPWL